MKATEKRADDRYPDAASFAADLRAFADDRPVSVRKASAFRRAQMAIRRNPVMGAYLKVVSAALALIAFGAWALLFAMDVANADSVKHYARLDAEWGQHVGRGWLPDLSRVGTGEQIMIALLEDEVFDPASPRPRYVITHADGLPHRIESVGPHGTPEAREGHPAILVQDFGLDHRVREIEHRDAQDNVVKRIRVDWEDADGTSCVRTFLGPDRQSAEDPLLGVAIERLVFDASGAVVERQFEQPGTGRVAAHGVWSMTWPGGPDDAPVCTDEGGESMDCPSALMLAEAR